MFPSDDQLWLFLPIGIFKDESATHSNLCEPDLCQLLPHFGRCPSDQLKALASMSRLKTQMNLLNGSQVCEF